MNNEALEALKSAVAKAKTMGLKGQDCVPAYIAEVCEAADKYLEALTPEVDLAELEQNICDYLSYTKYHKSEKHAVKYALVYLAERGLLRGDVAGDIKGLDAALMNAVKPHFNIDVMCPSCGNEVVTDNGEWLLWCGDKHHAEAILEAAKKYQAQIKAAME